MVDFLTKKLKIEVGQQPVFKFDDKIINFEEIGSVWYRKYGFFESSSFYKEASERYSFETLKCITREYYCILQYLVSHLRNKYWITSPSKVNLNKMEILDAAQKCGLNIPKTYIVNRLEYLDKQDKVIVKSVKDPKIVHHNGNSCMMYTTQVMPEDHERVGSSFLASMVQEKIDKKYEVRVFYLMGELYSMIIFSQNDPQTTLDFRQYNREKPNRFLPYKLPTEERKKIKKFMQSIDLNCGSIDLIKATDNKYYFLEVNPTGQFGMVDFPCNYGLHKRVAEMLIKLDR